MALVAFAFVARDGFWGNVAFFAFGVAFLLMVSILARLEELMTKEQQRPTSRQVAAAFRTGLIAIMIVGISVTVVVVLVALAQ
jgi:hypothetical protein